MSDEKKVEVGKRIAIKIDEGRTITGLVTEMGHDEKGMETAKIQGDDGEEYTITHNPRKH